MKLNKKIKTNRGMSYVELIVVLSIFSVLSSVVLYNYVEFQAKVDIKNLASDIALKIVEAQKSSLAGSVPDHYMQLSSWKPSYGLHFSASVDTNADNNDTNFLYFTDLNNNAEYDDNTCTPTDLNDECLDKVVITKNNTISSLDVFFQADTPSINLNDLTVTFTRPNSGAMIRSSKLIEPLAYPISYAQITILSPRGATSKIKLYTSGRIQID